MKTFTKRVLPISLIVGTMFALVGCSSNTTTTNDSKTSDTSVTNNSQTSGTNATNSSQSVGENSNKGITLKFQQWWAGELPSGVLQKICDGFTAKTGIKIKLLTDPFAQTQQQIESGAATGTMADVVGLDGSWIYNFAKQGSIANLTALMKADGYDDSQLSSQVKFNGQTYMIPVVYFAYPMYVNLDILKAAGIKTMPKTWSEFLTDTKKIKASTGKAGYAIPLNTESPTGVQNQFMSWLWASGGHMLNNGKPDLTNNANLTATAEFFKKLFDSGVVVPGASAMSESDMTEDFINGRVAFMIDSLAHITTVKKGAPNLNFKFIPVPVKDGYSGKSGNDVADWGIGIAQNSKHKAADMKFIEYLMSPTVNAELSAYAEGFPGNTTAKPDYSSDGKLFAGAYKIYQDGYPINEFTGAPTATSLKTTFDNQLQGYLNGKTSSPASMLAKTQVQWEKDFK